jgi:methionyl-tRNA synthetase
MDSLQFNKALDELWVSVRSLNQYLESVKPWELAKQLGKDPEAEKHIGEILAHSVGTLNQIAHMIAPFMPTTAQFILATFKDGVVREQPAVMFPKKTLHAPTPQA